MLELSLAWLHKRFDCVPITMVYVPSPLAIYREAGDMISFCRATGADLVARQASERHHDLIRDMVARISAEQRVDFIDATPTLRAAATTNVIHDPHDWDHLNEIGYQVLGTFVAARLRDSLDD